VDLQRQDGKQKVTDQTKMADQTKPKEDIPILLGIDGVMDRSLRYVKTTKRDAAIKLWDSLPEENFQGKRVPIVCGKVVDKMEEEVKKHLAQFGGRQGCTFDFLARELKANYGLMLVVKNQLEADKEEGRNELQKQLLVGLHRVSKHKIAKDEVTNWLQAKQLLQGSGCIRFDNSGALLPVDASLSMGCGLMPMAVEARNDKTDNHARLLKVELDQLFPQKPTQTEAELIAEWVESDICGDEEGVVPWLCSRLIKRKDLARLSTRCYFDKLKGSSNDTTKQWANDALINTYLKECAGLHNKDYASRGKKVEVFPTQFWGKLMGVHEAESAMRRYDFGRVKTWDKSDCGKGTTGKWMFPINVGEMHWILLVVFHSKKEIVLYDSSYTAGASMKSYVKYLRMIYEYTNDRVWEEEKDLLKSEEWKLLVDDKQPNQENCKYCLVVCSNGMDWDKLTLWSPLLE